MNKGGLRILIGAIELTLEELKDDDKLHELKNLQCVINLMIEQVEKRLDGNKRGEISRPF